MKCYLISNHTILDHFKIDSLNISQQDLVILFNNARPFGISGTIKNHKNKILFIRTNSAGSYSGLPHAIEKQEYYTKIVVINKNNSISKLTEKIMNYDLIEEPKMVEQHSDLLKEKKKNKTLTSGFIGFLYVKYNMGLNDKDICLINFTGGSSIEGQPAWSGHDYMFEQIFYKQNSICML